MEDFLDFMSSPAGIAIFSVVAVAIVILVLALNYRFFTKAVLDFIFGIIFFIVTSPVTAVCAAVVKSASEKVCTWCWIVGKGGKPVAVRIFSEYSRGEKQGYICRTWLRYLPALISVISGKLSLVGPAPVSLKDGTLISEEYDARFSVRPGIFSPAASVFAHRPEFEEMFAVDCDYSKKYNLFSDIYLFFVPFFHSLRGEKGGYLSFAKDDYADDLLARGAITGEQFEEADELATQSVKDLGRAKSRVG